VRTVSDLHAFLNEEARRISAPPDALEAFLDRGRRRRLAGRVATIVLALAISAAGLAGVLVSLGQSQGAPAIGGEDWAGIWPQTTLRQAEESQAAADAGDPGFAWQLDARQVIRRFAQEQLGWNGFSFIDIYSADGGTQAPPGYNNESDLQDPDASGPFRLIIAGCEHAPGRSCPGATVTIERLLRRDRTGIWSITKVEEMTTVTGAYPHLLALSRVLNLDAERDEASPTGGCRVPPPASVLVST
jgi:hypothetical protein